MSKADLKKDFGTVALSELNALYRTALRIVKDHDEAEDAVQESLDKGWRNLEQLEPDARLKPWLFRILTNTCLDHLRLKSRRPTVEFNDEDHSSLAPGNWSQQPDDELQNQQVGQAIAQQIDDLPEAQQAVVQLVIVEQFSYEDAAVSLDLPVGTVRSRLSRARAS
ncbi:MAG: RNA polymerase sigma factor, partial [Aestuariivirgaceae bacterium]